MENDTDQQESQNRYIGIPQDMIFMPSLSKQQSVYFEYDPDAEMNQIEAEQQFFMDEFQNNLWFQNCEDKLSEKEFQIHQIANVPLQIQPMQIQIQKKPKFQNKSYCRYILLYAFRTIENEAYSQIVMDICSNYGINFIAFKDYYRKQRILIMGYQQLKKELISDGDTIDVQRRKCAFKEFLIWYLNKVATKHILNSKKQDLREYLKFKNEVMSYYVHVPKNWVGNRPEWLKQQ